MYPKPYSIYLRETIRFGVQDIRSRAQGKVAKIKI